MTAAEARTLFRTLTNEQNTTVLPDATIDLFLQGGQEELNRRVGYFRKDDSVSLVADQQEYDLPSDFVSPVWVYWNKLFLAKNDVETWRQDAENWRDEPGAPHEYAVYGSQLALRKIPNAAAVAAAGTLTLRYVATPTAFSDADAFTDLFSQDHRLVVWWAVVEWSSARPDSALAVYRAQRFTALFESAAAACAAVYADRLLDRSARK